MTSREDSNKMSPLSKFNIVFLSSTILNFDISFVKEMFMSDMAKLMPMQTQGVDKKNPEEFEVVVADPLLAQESFWIELLWIRVLCTVVVDG